MQQQIQFKVTIAPIDDIGDGVGGVDRKVIINQLCKDFRSCLCEMLPDGYGIVSSGPMMLDLEKSNINNEKE